MSSEQLLEQAKQLRIEERILLVQDIWDSIAAENVAVELTQEQKDELDRRIAADERNPDEGRTWEEIRADTPKFGD